MPPRVRILLVCCAAAASGLTAQRGPASEYPAPPARPAWESGQQTLAQQYLAAPPREPASGETAPPARSAPSHANYGWAVDHDPPPVANDREPAFASGFGEADWPDRRAAAEEFAAPEMAAPGGSGAFGNADSAVREASYDAEPSAPPQLLPPPAIPPRPALVRPAEPEYAGAAASGGSAGVVPARHLGDDAPEPEAPGDAPAEAQPSDSSAARPERSESDALPLAQSREALPLEPPGAARSEGSRRGAGGVSSAVTVVGALAVVLGIFFAVAWGMRRAAPGALATLPSQVVEVLGRAPLAGRQQVHLLRCGNKLLLVSVTPDAAETLTEITDPLEVDRLAGLCEQMRPHSSTAAFRRVFQQYAHEGEGAHAS